MTLYQVVKAWTLPPASLCLALAVGLVISGRHRRTGRAILILTTIVFYLLSAPFVADRLAWVVATVPPLTEGADVGSAQAIVVLSAGSSRGGPEYDGVMVDHATLNRLRYGAHLYHRHPLPVLVSGGTQRGVPGSLAGAMKKALEEDFLVPVQWTEERSADTIENAKFSTPILRKAGVGSILLVTDATHMPRALHLFEAAGFTVIPAPTDFPGAPDFHFADAIPRLAALERSESAIYEILAVAWHGVIKD